jgi:hypothetical protein
MEYKGKLFGKIGNKYFDTGKTSDDFDELELHKNLLSWRNLIISKPICCEEGCWDGLKSSPIFVIDINKICHVATAYEGVLDGNYFLHFYSQNDFEIENVTHWMDIPRFLNG